MQSRASIFASLSPKVKLDVTQRFVNADLKDRSIEDRSFMPPKTSGKAIMAKGMKRLLDMRWVRRLRIFLTTSTSETCPAFTHASISPGIFYGREGYNHGFGFDFFDSYLYIWTGSQMFQAHYYESTDVIDARLFSIRPCPFTPQEIVQSRWESIRDTKFNTEVLGGDYGEAATRMWMDFKNEPLTSLAVLML